jgi:hypothetical protein
VKRCAFNVAAALSLILCLATAALWVRSYWRLDAISRATVEGGPGADSEAGGPTSVFTGFESERGGLLLYRSRQSIHRLDPPDYGKFRAEQEPHGWRHRTMPPDRYPDTEGIDDDPIVNVRFAGFLVLYERFDVVSDVQGRLVNGRVADLTVILPHWFLLMTLLVVPTTWWLRFHRQTMRRARGHCGRCGYDLRATPGRCPECGAVPAMK